MTRSTGADSRLETRRWLALGDFTLRLVRRKVRRLVRCPGFTAADREDLEQELLSKIWEATERFDPRLSHPHAFVATVIERTAATLARDRKATKRGNHIAHHTLSVPVLYESNCELAAETTGGGVTLAPSHEADRDLAMDLAKVTSRLPDDLRQVAEQLGNGSKRAIARKLGISRGVLDRRVEALRTEFVAAGFDEFF